MMESNTKLSLTGKQFINTKIANYFAYDSINSLYNLNVSFYAIYISGDAEPQIARDRNNIHVIGSLNALNVRLNELRNQGMWVSSEVPYKLRDNYRLLTEKEERDLFQLQQDTGLTLKLTS